MFIAIIGTQLSGKSTVADYLKLKGFAPVRIEANVLEDQEAPISDESRAESRVLSSNISDGSSRSVTHHNTTQDPIIPVSASRPSPLAASPIPTTQQHPKSTPDRSLCFRSAADLLDHVTKNWRSDFVTVDLRTVDVLQMFAKRPFFLLISVDAPVLARFRRYKRTQAGSLEDFLRHHDMQLYRNDRGARHPTPADTAAPHRASSLRDMEKYAHMRVVNDHDSVPAFHAHLDDLNLPDPDRLRPSWDTYFMTLAELASMRSNCMKRRVGAILVRDKRIVATGYNGTPRGLTNCNEGGCARCNGTAAHKEACLCLHAEENALLEAGRERIGSGAILYCNTCPCLTCTVKIVQMGVTEVVYSLTYKVDDASARLFQDAGVSLRRHAPPA